MSAINLKFLYALCYLTVKYAYKLLAESVHNAKNNSFKENQKSPNSETLDNRTRNIPQTLIPFTKFTQCLRGQLSLAAWQQGRARHAAECLRSQNAHSGRCCRLLSWHAVELGLLYLFVRVVALRVPLVLHWSGG